MAARMAGSKGTPEKIVKLLQEEVKRTSQAATARATGLTLAGVQNYLKGKGEPTTATLQKLAAYFGVTVAYLRGEEDKKFLDYIQRLPVAISLPEVLIDILDKIWDKEIVTDVDRYELFDATNIARWVLYAPDQCVDKLYAIFNSEKFEILKALSKEIIKKYDNMVKQCSPKEKKLLLKLRKEFEKSRFDAARGGLRRIE